MKYRLLSVAILIILLFSFFENTILADTGAAKAIPEVYVGIDAAYGDIGKIKELVNNISSYTNLFVIGCRAITSNTSSLDEACHYLYDKGLYFIIFQEDALGRVPFFSVVPSDWTKTAKTRWVTTS